MLIKLPDYERIYKTINAIVLNEGADPNVSCTFFAFYGAKILNDHYRIDAKAVSGFCGYHLGSDNVLYFGELNENEIISHEGAFHCWVVADGWLIDFMAPVFSEIMNVVCSNTTIPPKMMQKPLNNMADNVDSLRREGDFYFQINQRMIENRVSYLSSSLAYGDLAYICSKWYKKPPKKMIKQIPIADGKGTQKMVSLAGKSLIGAW